MTSPLIIRRATKADIDAFSTLERKPSAIVWCAELDGVIIGLAGFARVKGRWYAFCDLTDDLRRYPMHMMRWGRRIMAHAADLRMPYVYAQVDRGEPHAVCWLASLGFAPDPMSFDLYRWSLKTWQH
jgi:hypothetical protein